jgi:hypothetical protein
MKRLALVFSTVTAPAAFAATSASADYGPVSAACAQKWAICAQLRTRLPQLPDTPIRRYARKVTIQPRVVRDATSSRQGGCLPSWPVAGAAPLAHPPGRVTAPRWHAGRQQAGSRLPRRGGTAGPRPRRGGAGLGAGTGLPR